MLKKSNIFYSLLLSLSFFLMSTVCNAQEWSRKGKGEIIALGQHMSGDTTTGLGITMELEDTIAGGFGFGYNFSDHLNLTTAFFFGSMDVTAQGFGSKLEGDSTIIGWDLNLDINILKNRFSPLITGGIGFINFSGDWGGEVDFEETDFSYNVGVGFRWDVTDHFLIKAIYKATWTKLEDTDDAVLLDGVTLSIGYIF